jgi:aspartyl-tRNA(Asn)/glutamyl-tRNA(Gln) amidotransferase subunit A
MTPPELLTWSLAELASRLRMGEVSSREATLAVIAGLEEADTRLGAVARLDPERALNAADMADRLRGGGGALGLLHGVPLAHKDMFYRKGDLAECGALLMRGHRADVTATVLRRLDAAGAIDVGRLNMVEFALGITGHNAHTGHPRNPWDTSRITGGSTSGGAAAVAARLLPATLGSDTGGSIRYPAAACGILGLKPTYGRVSRYGCMPLSYSLDHVGPLARTAEDVALMLQAIAGQDPDDPTTSSRPVIDYRASMRRGAAGLRLAVALGAPDAPVEAEVAGSVEGAAGVLTEAGMRVRRLGLPPVGAVNALRRVVMLVECAALHRERVAAHRDGYNPQTVARMEPGFQFSGVDYTRALSARAPLLRRFCAEVFAETDILALPTCPVTTPGIAETDTGGDARFTAIANRLGTLVGPFNYLGLPALSLPVGHDAQGMPLGLQLVARPFGEGLLLRAAHAFEEVAGIAARWPALADRA